MRVDPKAEARRLLAQIDAAGFEYLAEDPASAVEALFGVEVVTCRPSTVSAQGCAVDGTYHPNPSPTIRVANDVPLTRQRFTVLHELGHHLIEHDHRLNDLEIDDTERRDEDICNEIAAAILIPTDVVGDLLPVGKFRASDVAALYDATGASREACCVAAARCLRSAGCVILGRSDGTAVFTAHDPTTPWRIARGTPQDSDSLLVKAARRSTGYARGVTRVRFASGNVSGKVHGDAFAADDGWVYEVVVVDSHSPWERTGWHVITDPGPEGEEIECGNCGEASRSWRAPCRSCGDRVCDKCSRCSCSLIPTTRLCTGCFLQKPLNQFVNVTDTCVDCA